MYALLYVDTVITILLDSTTDFKYLTRGSLNCTLQFENLVILPVTLLVSLQVILKLDIKLNIH